MASLKQKVLNSLGSWDAQTQKWIAGNDLRIALSEAKVKQFFANDAIDAKNYADELLSNLNNDNIFNSIFSIAQ